MAKEHVATGSFCVLCKRHGHTERHHIFGGSNRKHSERYGLVVSLCPMCHREGKQAAHRSKETMQQLHEYGQRLWMEQNSGSVEDFRAIFGKSYL